MNSTLLKYQRIQDIKSLFFCNISAHLKSRIVFINPFLKEGFFWRKYPRNTFIKSRINLYHNRLYLFRIWEHWLDQSYSVFLIFLRKSHKSCSTVSSRIRWYLTGFAPNLLTRFSGSTTFPMLFNIFSSNTSQQPWARNFFGSSQRACNIIGQYIEWADTKMSLPITWISAGKYSSNWSVRKFVPVT